VDSAAAVLIRPLSGAVGWDTDYTVEGQSEIQRRSNPNGNYEAISPDYFRTMGIRLIAGRDFTGADNHASTAVVIINAATAKRHWPHGSVIGKRVRLGTGPKSEWATVVGVSGDVRYREWEAARPDFYIPFLQRAQHRSDFVVKTSKDPSLLAEAVRKAILAIDKTQPISNVTTMAELVDRAVARSRFNGIVLGCLAGCAVILTALGIYSVLAYMVGQSEFEIALRMAVGAMPAQVAKMVAARGMRVVIAGGVIGLGGAALASRLLTALLFGVPAFDPWSYSLAFVILILLALAACAPSALRASAIDPARALRSGS
jgi:predicted permease